MQRMAKFLFCTRKNHFKFPAKAAAVLAMSGEQFCRLLKELGYDGSTTLSLDWLFDYEVLSFATIIPSTFSGHKANASMDGD